MPTVFVTNAGNLLRVTKANSLSKLLGIEVGFLRIYFITFK